jgi:hypothetical protein
MTDGYDTPEDFKEKSFADKLHYLFDNALDKERINFDTIWYSNYETFFDAILRIHESTSRELEELQDTKIIRDERHK